MVGKRASCKVVGAKIVSAHCAMSREGEAPDPPGPLPATPALCRHWARRGRCDYGDGCRFRHERVPGDDADADDPRVSAMDGRREGATRFGRRHHARNRNKAGDFRRWLVATFGFETLASGAGVLDVAGGKGELAFELRNLSGIPVTVVDPRPMRLERYVRRFRSGMYHRNQSPAAAKLRRPLHSTLAAPDHLRMFLHRGVFDPARSEGERRLAALESHALSHATRWSRRGLVDGKSAPGDGDGDGKSAPGDGARDGACLDEAYRIPGEPVRHATMFSGARRRDTDVEDADVQADVDDDVEDDDVEDADVDDPDAAAMAPVAMDASATADACERVIRDCSVVVGLHPDQATDAAVDLALAFGKPFAVVPCCTYSRDFPHRRLPPGPGRPKGGGAVTTHAHLVEYLLAKAPPGMTIERDELPFEGKNVVVYSLGAGEGELLCRAVDGLEVGERRVDAIDE